MTTTEPLASTGTETMAAREGRTFHLLARTPIAAPAADVWRVLVDLERWHDWNPFLVEASGTVAVGCRPTIRFRPQGSSTTTMRPTITAVEPDRHLAWMGHFLFPHVFDGAHAFTITPTPGGCELVQEETFRGALVPLLRGWLTRRTLPAFVDMNEALRARVSG